MTAMTKKFKVIAILLSMVLIAGIVGCGKPKASQRKSKSVQITQEAAALTPTASDTAVPANVSANTVEPGDIPVQSRVLPADEFGRDNPFVPLWSPTGGRNTVAAVKAKNPMDEDTATKVAAKTIVKKPEAPLLPNVRLSLVIDGSTAIFEENKASKVASVGDTISGMRVLEIRRNEAVLSNGLKKFIVTTVGIREESSSPAQIENIIPKNSKAKAKKK
jgi:hypothetical protein